MPKMSNKTVDNPVQNRTPYEIIYAKKDQGLIGTSHTHNLAI